MVVLEELIFKFLFGEGVVVLKKLDFLTVSTLSTLGGCVVLKESILTISTLGGSGCLERTDF